MQKIKRVIEDVVYVSRLTKTRNKKKMIALSVLLSNLSAAFDILIIAIFSVFIVGQYPNISIFNKVFYFFINNKNLIFLLVFCRFLFQYLQKTLIYKIELEVNKNLKIYILKEVFEKKNFSTADSYFFINILSMHLSFFYSSVASFLHNVIQILIYLIYLSFSDANSIIIFVVGSIIMAYPISVFLKKSRQFMHNSYLKGQESNREIEKVVDNLFLIKILKKENFEIQRFTKIVDEYRYNIFNNYKYGLINSIFPSFLTLFVLSFIIVSSKIVNRITLDFIGVTLRLFQSLGNLANSTNQIINSHVHLEKFYEMEKLKTYNSKNNYLKENSNSINFTNVEFSYANSQIPIFKNLNLSIPKHSHTIINGPNGSGKSTLLGLISGIYFASDGKVTTFSDEMGYIGPLPHIFDATLKENIMYGNKKKINEQVITKMLKEFKLFSESKDYNLKRIINNKTLSSGQMQKLAFIRAILAEPKILLLDESTANLDLETKYKVFSILKNLEITIINSTHDEDISKIADYRIQISVVNEQRELIIKNINEKNLSN